MGLGILFCYYYCIFHQKKIPPQKKPKKNWRRPVVSVLKLIIEPFFIPHPHLLWLCWQPQHCSQNPFSLDSRTTRTKEADLSALEGLHTFSACFCNCQQAHMPTFTSRRVHFVCVLFFVLFVKSALVCHQLMCIAMA